MDKLDENKNYSEAIKNILKVMDKRNLDSVDNIENEVKKLVDKEKEIIKERNIDPVNPDDLYYQKSRKAPHFSHGDIRLFLIHYYFCKA